MESVLGTTVWVFVGLTVCVMGFAAFMTGQALANTWKPAWQAAAYAVPLGLAARFLIFALFDGELLSVSGTVADVVALGVIALVAHRVSMARRMVSQYPWLYERTGPFGWRPRAGHGG